MEKAEHIVYISLFIETISDRPDLLLYSGYLLLKSSKTPEVKKRWEILTSLYMKDIQSSDQRLIRLRCIISDYVNGLESQEKRCLFLRTLIDRLKIDFRIFNPNVISFLHLFLSKNIEIPSEISKCISLYLVGCIEYESRDKKGDFHGLEEIYASIAAKALILSEDAIAFDHSDSSSDTYYLFTASCLAWRRGEFPDEYFETLKEQMLYFLFKASKEQTDELGLLVEKKQSRFVVKFDELYEIPRNELEPIN